MVRHSCAFFVAVSFLLLGCSEAPTTSNTASPPSSDTRWPIVPGSANFAVLVADYPTMVFEGGQLLVLTPCSGCDETGMPIASDYNPPGDFGDITFAYTETNATVFKASIIWMGQGVIEEPPELEAPSAFDRMPKAPSAPESFEHFNVQRVLDDVSFEKEAMVVWETLRDLDIVTDFARADYRVAFYLWAPTVGLFDPAPAKWVVFLYRG